MTDTKNKNCTSVNTGQGIYNLVGDDSYLVGTIPYKAENFDDAAIKGVSASSPSTPDIISGTVLSIDKNGKLISRKALKIDGVIKYLSDGEVEKLCDRLPKELQIRSIAYSDVKSKEKVIVVFQDGTKVIKHLLKGDHFDLNIGVALAFMEKLYGTKSQYHKMIQKKVQKPKVKKETQKQADTK